MMNNAFIPAKNECWHSYFKACQRGDISIQLKALFRDQLDVPKTRMETKSCDQYLQLLNSCAGRNQDSHSVTATVGLLLPSFLPLLVSTAKNEQEMRGEKGITHNKCHQPYSKPGTWQSDGPKPFDNHDTPLSSFKIPMSLLISIFTSGQFYKFYLSVILSCLNPSNPRSCLSIFLFPQLYGIYSLTLFYVINHFCNRCLEMHKKTFLFIRMFIHRVMDLNSSFYSA